MIGKILGVVGCFAAIVMQAGAQELGIGLDGGMQGMHYPLKNGQTQLRPGGSLGLNYTFWFSSQVGLLTGVTGGLYRNQATLQDGAVLTYGEVDDAGSAFQYRLKFRGYQETQHFFAASIPLLLEYHSGGAGMQWYVDGGAKLFIPFNATSQISAQQVTLSGYYPDFNVEVANLPQHGFGTLNNWNGSATAKLKPAAALSAGAGIVFRLAPGMSFYTGLFADLGLTNVKSNNDTLPLMSYSSKGINGAQSGSVMNTGSAGRATLLSYGLQVRLSFGSPRARSAARPKTTEVPPSTGMPSLSYYESVVTLGPVVFGNAGETDVPESVKSRLDEVANLLNRYPNSRLAIVGHYCSSETETEDRRVGEARARAVARYLQSKGIPRGRLEVSAAAEGDPVRRADPNANYFSRRVVLSVR